MTGDTNQDGKAIGTYLSFLRDTANLTQAELAKKVTVSPARISRIESGDVALTEDEMDQLLDAIGTSAAKELRTYLDQDWDELDRPPFDHPNRNVLWVANGVPKCGSVADDLIELHLAANLFFEIELLLGQLVFERGDFFVGQRVLDSDRNLPGDEQFGGGRAPLLRARQSRNCRR